jgi:hypothetical protein
MYSIVYEIRHLFVLYWRKFLPSVHVKQISVWDYFL